MGVREIDRFLEQWQMDAKALRRRDDSGRRPGRHAAAGRGLDGGDGQERVGNFLAGLASRRAEVRRRCGDGPAIKGRSTPAEFPARFLASGKCTSHLCFGLGLGRTAARGCAYYCSGRRRRADGRSDALRVLEPS